MKKVLIVGLGGVGQRHVRNLRTLLGDQVKFIAYRVRRLPQVITPLLRVEPDSNVEKAFDIEVFNDLELALRQKPAMTFVCNPSSLHIQVALAAARAGSHVFLEKPLSDTLKDVGELHRELQSRNLIGFVGYQMRFHPCLKQVRQLLATSAVGQIIAVRAQVAEYLPGWHPYEDYRQSYAARRDLGGGVILTQIHELDYLYWMFGLPQRIFALGGHLSRLDVDVEDTASILMDYRIDGRKVPVHVHADYLQRPGARTLEIIGDTGKILVDLRALVVTAFDEQGQSAGAWKYDTFERNELFLDELRHFLACIEGGETPSVTIRDGARSLQMALAARQSLESGQVVDFPTDDAVFGA
jgi:predicted dehydrogenase